MQQLKQARDNCKVGYEMYLLYRKVTNMISLLEGGKEESIKVDYRRIDNVTALIKLSNCLKKFPQFEEDLKELQNVLDAKIVQYKKYVVYCQTLKDGPLEEKYYSHILDPIKEIEDDKIKYPINLLGLCSK